MSGFKFLIGVLLFWVLLGGILQIFDLDNNNTGLSPDTGGNGGVKFLWEMATFQIEGMPISFSVTMTLFMISALSLAIFVTIVHG